MGQRQASGDQWDEWGNIRNLGKWWQAGEGLNCPLHPVATCACTSVCFYSMYVLMYVCMHACMYIALHVPTYLCVYACLHACMPACMRSCMYVCMYACRYVGKDLHFIWKLKPAHATTPSEIPQKRGRNRFRGPPELALAASSWSA